MADQIPDSILSALRGKYPDADLHSLTHRIEDDTFVAVVRASGVSGEWRRFKQQSVDAAKRASAAENLFRACTVWTPGAKTIESQDVKAAVDDLLERKPGLADTFGNKLAAVLGLDQEAEAKKL